MGYEPICAHFSRFEPLFRSYEPFPNPQQRERKDLDSDPHQCGKQDPDPDPHQNEGRVQIRIRICIKVMRIRNTGNQVSQANLPGAAAKRFLLSQSSVT